MTVIKPESKTIEFNNLFIIYFLSKIIDTFGHLAFAKVAR